ncbi:MAG: 1-acyl-sn-glycerol-3-phosphate acyltransferase [Bacteroidales bacterium]|nr:1-acyl-sn-glycerol-3-phosphate acyltransferase [Bacteroidales bacterium]
MIKPSHSRFYQWFFYHYFNFILKRHFREIKVISNIEIDSKSILLVPNHFSWWDGFIAWHLNKNHLNKKFHLLMLESELSKHRFFTKLGAFSISRTSRGLYDSLIFASNLIKEQGNILVFYPQGKLFSQHHITLEFAKGIERILQDKPDCRIIMATNLIDYYGFKKPTLSIYLNEYIYDGSFNLTQFQFVYNMFLKQSIHQQDKIFKQ